MAVRNLTIFGQECQLHFFAFGFLNIIYTYVYEVKQTGIKIWY